MATQTLANYDAILKIAYRGAIVDLLNQETYLIDKLEKTAANDLGTFTGRQLLFPVHTARNRGRGAGTDGGALVTAGRQSYLDAIVAIKYFDTGIELTDQVIRQSQTDEGAFARSMDAEMSGAGKDLRKDISRMAYGTGDGLLATVNATSSGSAVIQVDSGQYIAVGDTVDVLVKSSGATITNGSAVSVTAVTYNGTADSTTQAQAQVTLSGGNVSVSNIHGVYISGDRNNESDGLRNICNTGRILHSIDSSTNPIWDSNVTAAGQVNANEDLFMKLAQTIRQRGGTTIDSFLTSLGVQRRLANTYVSQKRWNDDRATLIDGGYEAINISAGGKATPVISDVDAVNGTAFALRTDTFAWAELSKPDWLESPDGKGSIFHLKDGTTAATKVRAWQAWMVWDATLVNTAPLKNGQITGLNDDKPVARV